jgi:hypothetical protein
MRLGICAAAAALVMLASAAEAAVAGSGLRPGSDPSASAPCRKEADAHLKTLLLARNQVKSVHMFNRNVGDTLRGIGTDGHEAWVRLNTCSGWLVIQLSKGCYPRQTFTRGNCEVEGVSSY